MNTPRLPDDLLAVDVKNNVTLPRNSTSIRGRHWNGPTAAATDVVAVAEVC